MKLCILFLIARAAHSAGIADIISSYAKVAVNNGTQPNITRVIKPLNDTDEDGPVDYEDFDDATEVRGQSSDMLKYINGFVNLLSLMYKFSGNRGQGRSGNDALSNSVNNLAEDRYHPSTETKRFKYEGFPPIKSSAYNPSPSNAAETYSNSGKTSYDSDASQFTAAEGKNPMKDYMSQNDVDIRPSYSYEIPQKGDDEPPGPVYYQWMSKTTVKPKDESWGGMMKKSPWMTKPDHDEKPIETYPWMTKPSKPVPHDDTFGDQEEKPIETYPWMTKPSKPIPHDDTFGDHEEKPIESYPWMTHEEKEEDTYGMVPPPKKSKPPPEDDHVYPYPYLHDEEHDDEDKDLKDEDRESKRPYTYYHLGRKLWYVPLLFSMYFILYIASLLLKSIARHKVQFPEKLWEMNEHDHHHHHHGDHSRRGRKLEEVTESVHNGIDRVSKKYM